METLVLRNPPDGAVIQYDTPDYGKPIGVIPSGPQAGQVGPINLAQFNVNASTDLTPIAPAWIGAVAYVNTQRCAYVAVPVGKGDITGTGVDWKRLSNTSDPAWRAQTTWSINATTGDDDATGVDDAHALKSWDELSARCGGGRILLANDVSVRILSDLPSIVADIVQVAPDVTFTIAGVPSLLVSTAVTGIVQSAGNLPRRITAAGILDWAAAGYVFRRMRVTGGTAANVGAIAWVAKSNADAAGANWARLSQPQTEDTNLRTLAVDDTFDIESLPSVGVIDLRVSGYIYEGFAVGKGPLQVRNLSSGQVNVRTWGFFNNACVFFGCDLSGSLNVDNWNPRAAVYARACGIRVASLSSGFRPDSCLFSSYSGATSVVFEGAEFADSGHNLFQGVRCSLVCSQYQNSGTNFHMDSTAAGLTIATATVAAFSSGLLGSGNTTYGVEMRPGGRLSYASASQPTVTGTSGDIRLLVANQTLPWSALPWLDGARSGNGVALIAGNQAVVAVPYVTAAQAITVSHNTPAGAGAPGILQVRDADRTTTQFGVRSSLGTDAGTFNWNVSALGFNQFIHPQL